MPAKFHGQRRLVDYILWGQKESDVIEWLSIAAQHIETTTITIAIVFRTGAWGHQKAGAD